MACRKNKISGIWLQQRKERVCPASSRQIQGKDESKGQGTHQQKNGKRLRKVEGRPETVCRLRELLSQAGRYGSVPRALTSGCADESAWSGKKEENSPYKMEKLMKLGISNRNAGILANSRKGYSAIVSSPILQQPISQANGLRRLDSSSLFLLPQSPR